mmetsp:Transcript_24696/g.68740  ORF Transcript_24696/g.68740 Transcript_24696/m.68740 type:complete len:207 (-) Transcript_24696:3751-4371(-)
MPPAEAGAGLPQRGSGVQKLLGPRRGLRKSPLEGPAQLPVATRRRWRRPLAGQPFHHLPDGAGLCTPGQLWRGRARCHPGVLWDLCSTSEVRIWRRSSAHGLPYRRSNGAEGDQEAIAGLHSRLRGPKDGLEALYSAEDAGGPGARGTSRSLASLQLPDRLHNVYFREGIQGGEQRGCGLGGAAGRACGGKVKQKGRGKQHHAGDG